MNIYVDKKRQNKHQHKSPQELEKEKKQAKLDLLKRKLEQNKALANTKVTEFSGNKVVHTIELDELEGWRINKPNGSKWTTNGPYANQEAAQKGYNMNLIGLDDGMVNDSKVIDKREPKLEKGNMTTVNGIILHRTDSYSAQGSLTSFKRGIGTHFLIGKDGSIYQASSINKKNHHVGKIKSKCYETNSCTPAEKSKIKGYGWSPKNVYYHEITKDYPSRYPHNSDAIGIEVVGKYNSSTKTWEKLTSQQIEAASYLVNLLKKNLNLKFSDVYTHEQVSYKTKGEGQVVLDAIKDKIQDLPVIQ